MCLGRVDSRIASMSGTRPAQQRRRFARVLPAAAGLLLASACSTGHPLAPRGSEASATMPVPPPAVSGINDTISVTFGLADSFDVLPNGNCAGRDTNSGMTNGARVQLRGDTAGGSVWSTATVRLERRPPESTGHG
jgi:hypothetical protein